MICWGFLLRGCHLRRSQLQGKFVSLSFLILAGQRTLIKWQVDFFVETGTERGWSRCKYWTFMYRLYTYNEQSNIKWIKHVRKCCKWKIKKSNCICKSNSAQVSSCQITLLPIIFPCLCRCFILCWNIIFTPCLLELVEHLNCIYSKPSILHFFIHFS